MISTSTKLFSFFFMRALVLLSQQFNLLFWYETVIEEWFQKVCVRSVRKAACVRRSARRRVQRVTLFSPFATPRSHSSKVRVSPFPLALTSLLHNKMLWRRVSPHSLISFQNGRRAIVRPEQEGECLISNPVLRISLYFLISRGGGEGKEKKDFEETGRLRALQDLIFLSQPWGKWKSWTKPAPTR